MLDQPSFADLDYQHKRHKTRREQFLERLGALVSWSRLEARILPHYPKAGKGRRPYPLSVMLRVHVVQICHNLSDPAMEAPRPRGGRLCCTRRSRCDVSWGCGCRNPYPTRALFCTSVTCWSDANWGRDCLRRSGPTWGSGG